MGNGSQADTVDGRSARGAFPLPDAVLLDEIAVATDEGLAAPRTVGIFTPSPGTFPS